MHLCNRYWIAVTLLFFAVFDLIWTEPATAKQNAASHLDTATKQTFKCPSNGYYAASQNVTTNKFWLCVDGVANQFVCPQNTHFNVHENKCTEWIDENSTLENMNQTKKHHKSHHLAHGTHHKHHRTRHQHQRSHHGHHVLERLHRRIDELDSRLDQLYAYVDSQLRNKTAQPRL